MWISLDGAHRGDGDEWDLFSGDLLLCDNDEVLALTWEHVPEEA